MANAQRSTPRRQIAPDVTFNGLRFAMLGSVAPPALADAYHGFYLASARGVHLYTRDEQVAAYVVANQQQGHFVVTAWRESGGRTRYMHSTCTTTESWLNLNGLGYLARHDVVQAMNNPKAPAPMPA